MRTLLLSLLLASSALAQGMPGPVASAAWRPSRASGCVASWDASSAAKAAGHVLVGGVDFVPADNDYLARTSGAIPGISGGVPTYPLTLVGAFKTDNVGATTSVVANWDDGTAANRILVFRDTAVLKATATEASAGSDASTTSSLVAGRWHFFVAVFSSASSRSIYLDTDTTGATEGTARTIAGLSALRVGRIHSGAAEWDGELGPMWLFNADLSGSANAAVRTAIFNGADPERASGFTAIEHWPMEAATGASRSGSYDLTASGTPVATSRCLVVRDVKANTYHLRATTSAPDYDSTLFSNRGGVSFASASSEFLVCESTPVTAAPMQVYAVARSTSATADQTVFWLGDKDTASAQWYLQFSGAQSGDPVWWNAQAGGGTTITATSSGYSADTTTLLWGLEASSTSRSVRINGGSEGTSSTSTAPAGADRINLGGRGDSSPSDFLNGGSFGYGSLLNTASTEERPAFHRYFQAEFGLALGAP